LELQTFWATHPKYRDIVEHIQGKYSFRERPSYGIVLKTSSANMVQLSADNFLGTVESYIHLAKVAMEGGGEYPGLAVEWVREDGRAIQENGGTFPSPAGIYYITLTADKEFEVEPLVEVQDETLTHVGGADYIAAHPFLDGSIRIYQMPGAVQLVPGVNLTINPDTGGVSLAHPLAKGQYLSVDYRYAGDTTGPWAIKENYANKGAIPGVVLAFGRRCEVGDCLAVVVHSRRQPTALEYGGKWEISLDFDIVARDPYAQQEISDMTVMFLWGVVRNQFSTEGIEITSISMGGESEEVYDENADDYYYNASISLSLQTDWAIHVPLTAIIRRVGPQTPAQIAEVAGLTDDELRVSTATLQNIQVLESLGLTSYDDPFFAGRTITFEKVR